jgi:hypothetical protein
MEARSNVVSSFTIVKGALIPQTYAVFREWDDTLSKAENLKRARLENTMGATSANWALNVAKSSTVASIPRDATARWLRLAKAGCDPEVWKPLLLYHMTRDEFLVRDFLVNWLYPQFTAGAYRLRAEDVMPYLQGLSKKKGIAWSGHWSESTSERVASGLLRIAADFGLLQGLQAREFASYHLPEQSFPLSAACHDGA